MLYDRTDDEEMLTLPNSTTSEYIVLKPFLVYKISDRIDGL